jgi:FlgN protein.
VASLIEELINTLEQEYDLYKQLIPIADKKTKVIVTNDLDSLQEITSMEQVAIDKISALEHKRETVMMNIKTVINRKEELNVKSLVGLLGNQPNEQKALSIVRDKLRNVILNFNQINNRNKSLIQQSLEMIEFNMNFIQSTRMSPGNNTYTKGASKYEAQARGTGMFDAKQ